MAEHFLNNSQVGSSGEQVGGEAMAQEVGIDIGVKTSACGIAFEKLPYPLRRQLSAAHGKEDFGSGAPGDELWSLEFEIAANGSERLGADGHEARLVALPGYADHAFGKVQPFEPDIAEF